MPEKLLHILNGDALAEKFPESIQGKRISFREALVEGPAEIRPIWEYFDDRDEFMQFTYGQYDIPDYQTHVVPELNKLKNIDRSTSINLWFEDDLFCQVNFWYLLLQFVEYELYLIRPTTDLQHGFGTMKEEDLVNAFLQRTKLTTETKDQLSCLWPSYVHNDIAQMRRISIALPEAFEFIRPALYANIDRQPDEESPGRLIRRLKEIIQDLHTRDFGEVFQEFSRTEAIYGYGDLQVKRLFDIAVKNI